MAENSLPKGWVQTQLGKVFSIITGNTPSKKNSEYYGSDIPWVKPADINRSTVLFETDDYLSQLGSKKARMLPKGAVMVTCIGNLGYVAIAGKECATNQQINSIVDNTRKINTKYIYYFSFGLKPWLAENSTSTTISMVNKTVFSKAPFYFPSRPEQDRIVAKVDILMAQVESMQKRLARIPQLLKDFRQQVLTQAVTGQLTEEWRDGKSFKKWTPTKKEYGFRPLKINLPKSWNVFAFQTAANINANLKDPNEYLDHILVAPNHIEKYTGRLIETQLTSDILPKSDKHHFEKGSIIYSKIRPYLSKLILADFDGLCSADMYPITAEINQKYLYHYMLSQIFLKYATTAGERSVLPKINQKGLNNIPVPVPPIEEQQEIVRRVESLFSKADAIESQYQSLKTKIDTLPQAILHKAFKGELVPQFASDGDARDLLKQIEALKTVGGKKTKTKTRKLKSYKKGTETLRQVAEEPPKYSS